MNVKLKIIYGVLMFNAFETSEYKPVYISWIYTTRPKGCEHS